MTVQSPAALGVAGESKLTMLGMALAVSTTARGDDAHEASSGSADDLRQRSPDRVFVGHASAVRGRATVQTLTRATEYTWQMVGPAHHDDGFDEGV